VWLLFPLLLLLLLVRILLLGLISADPLLLPPTKDSDHLLVIRLSIRD